MDSLLNAIIFLLSDLRLSIFLSMLFMYSNSLLVQVAQCFRSLFLCVLIWHKRPARAESGAKSQYPYVQSLIQHRNPWLHLVFLPAVDNFSFLHQLSRLMELKTTVRLPVGECHARAIIARSNQASYSKGQQTIVDRSVRNVWELDPL